MKKGKPKLPDLMKVMDSFQMARSILKCGSRSLRHRCDPSVDRDAAMPDLYDEIVLFTTATGDALPQLVDLCERAVPLRPD